MQLGRFGLVSAFVGLATHASCTPSAPEPPRLPHVEQKLPPPDAVLPPTPSEGTPYTFRNVVIRGGGFVTGIVFSQAKAGVVYARTDVGGAYRFDAANQAWIPLTDMFGRAEANLTGVESIAADPIDVNKVYAAVGTYAQSWAPNGAILRSADQGHTWQRTEMPIRMGGNELGRSVGERLAVDPNDTSHLWFGSRRNGLWRSIDAGVTWNKVDTFPQREDSSGLGVGFVVFDAQSGKRGKPTARFYVGVLSGDVALYVTDDGGASFRALAKQPSKLTPSHAAFDARGTLYISYGNAPGPNDVTNGAVFKYDPKTEQFTNISPLAPSDSDRFGYGGLAVDIQHPGTLLVTTIDRWARGDEIFRSTDGGKRWVPLLPKASRDAAGANYLYFGRDKLGPPGWMGDIDIDPFDANHVLHVCGQGVWASTDVNAADKQQATHWSFRDQGLEEAVVTRLLSPPIGAELVSGVADICGFRHDDLAKPVARGMHTNPVCNATTGLDFAAQRPDLMVRVGSLWGAGKHGAISKDGGKTWLPFESEPAGAESGGTVSISADGDTLVWAIKKQPVVYSRDRGASWRSVAGLKAPIDSPAWLPVNLQLASDRVNAQKIYAYDTAQGQLYRSLDGGALFEATQAGLPGLPEWARASGSIQAMPNVEGDVWLTTGKSVFRSLDSGKTFSELAGIAESHALGFGMGAPGRLNPSVFLVGKVGDTAGFFRSDDLGRSFVRINDELHQFGFVSHIVGDPRRFGRVYIGTGGRGILLGEPH